MRYAIKLLGVLLLITAARWGYLIFDPYDAPTYMLRCAAFVCMVVTLVTGFMMLVGRHREPDNFPF